MDKAKLTSLVARAQKGDAEALNGLFEEYYPDAYYFALKTAKEPELAADITQEAFIEIFETLGKLKEPAAFVSWSRQIIYHRLTRYFGKTREVIADQNEEGETVFDSLREENSEFIPDEALDNRELKNIIMSIIDTLSPEQRSAVMLFYFDELSIREIAEIQGVNENTVKSRLNYGKKAIRTAVEEFEKKNGVKLRAIPFFPLLWKLFSSEKASVAASPKLLSSLSLAKSTVGISTAAAGVGLSVGGKIGIGLAVVAATLTIGTAAALVLPQILPENSPSSAPTSSAVSEEKTPEAEEEKTPALEQTETGEIIPEGGKYVIHHSMFDSDDEYIEGDGKTARFPEEICYGDQYYFGDYLYTADEVDGEFFWRASVSDNTLTEYGELLTYINGAPLKSLSCAFAFCENMTTAPVIPETVEDMLGTFQHCYALETSPVIPKNVTEMAYTFENCTSLQGTVVIHANPTSTNCVFYGTEHPIFVTGDSEVLEEFVSNIIIFGDVSLLQP